MFVASLMHGRQVGPPGSPAAIETKFGWVLAGSVESQGHIQEVTMHHVSLLSGDDLLRKFWEIEEGPSDINLSPEERAAVSNFKENHRRAEDGRFIVPLPRKPNHPSLGESRSRAVKRFLALERSLKSKGELSMFNSVMQVYLDLCHAEPVPTTHLEKPTKDAFYLPMHTIKKEASTTTKIRAIFDASAESASGVFLNDLLLIGPTVHPPLIDVLLHFRLHRVALTTDVSKRYRAKSRSTAARLSHDSRHIWRLGLLFCSKHINQAECL